jgi:hypothetical protein
MRHKKEAHYERNINVQFVEDMDDMKYIVECKECELKVKRKADLKRHEVGRHSSSRSYQCSSCDETFPRNDGLTRHMKSTHLNEKKKTLTLKVVFTLWLNYYMNMEMLKISIWLFVAHCTFAIKKIEANYSIYLK